MQLSEQTKLIALAYLKQGMKPKEVAEEANMSYSQALKLSKQLVEAERRDAVLELFNVEEAVMDQLLEAVKNNDDLLSILPQETLSGELETFKEAANGLGMLDREMQDTALELTKRIKILAVTSTNADTISSLSESLAKLQTAFFAKGANVQVNNFNSAEYEKYLRD